MQMYEYLKMLQPVAEQVGEVKNVCLHDGDTIWSDRVKLSGKTADGKRFHLELTLEEPKDADS